MIGIFRLFPRDGEKEKKETAKGGLHAKVYDIKLK